MRGQREKTSLDEIKRFLFYDKLQQPHVWNGKTAFDYSDEEFPVENIDGDKWHFEPLPGVTMDVKLESEETSELSI